MTGLSSYGGDPRVIASRDEMLRVKHRLSSAVQGVLGQMHPLAFMHHTIAHLQLAVHVPALLARLESLEWACQSSADGFLTSDARLAVHLRALETFLDDQPWLRALMRSKLANHVLTGALLAIGVGQFLNGRAAVQLTRGVVNSGPLLFGAGDSHNAANNARELGSWLVARENRLWLGRETPIKTVSLGPPLPSQNPKNIASLAARLNQVAGSGRAEIRVETGAMINGSRTFVIYVPGTESLALAGKSNSLDLNSAIHSFANDGNAAVDRALAASIAKAGVTANDTVVFVGYSQGGLAAANLIAGSHDFRVGGLVTFGAPIGHIPLPIDVPVLALEHTNDPIPALSGQTNPLTSEWVTAQREYPLAIGHPAIESHSLSAYIETANAVDVSRDVGLVRVTKQIEEALVQTQTSKVSWFAIDRA